MRRDLDRVPTPALLLDRSRLAGNLSRMASRARGFGVALRPHLKTAKSARVAELALAEGAVGITVSTLQEAEYFADHGVRDITYAVGVVASKLERAAAFTARGVRLQLLTDNPETARAIAARAADGGPFRVMIEIDTGDQRTGLPPDAPELLEVASVLHQADGVELAGVLTHAGQSYECASLEEIRRVARDERDGVVRAHDRLTAAGLPCPVVSAGSTPTAVCGDDWRGVTELRPGCYVFFDLYQEGLGTCVRAELALSVMASVIGHHRRAGHLVVDAGALALSKDASATRFHPEIGYGEVCDAESLAPHVGLAVRSVNQEHGMIPVRDQADFDRLPIGSKVRILPNHACITAAAHDRYYVVEGPEVVEEWDRANGW